MGGEQALPSCKSTEGCNCPKDYADCTSAKIFGQVVDFCKTRHLCHPVPDADGHFGGGRELACTTESGCQAVLVAASGEIESSASALTTFLIGLCVVVGFVYQKIFEATYTWKPHQGSSLAVFSLAALTSIFFGYWVRFSMASQLAGKVKYANAAHVLNLTSLEGVATLCTALVTLSVVLAAAWPEERHDGG